MVRVVPRRAGDGASASSVDMRLAAYLIGVKRVAEATQLRGIYP